jgi:hypothetical protein
MEAKAIRKEVHTMKTSRTIRFEDTILKDVDAFAGRHKLKDQDGNFDFSNAIHTRYMELLQKEHDYEQAAVDVKTWKNYAGTQEATTKTYCLPLQMMVLPQECAACAERRVKPDCPKTKPTGQGP